MNRAMRRKEQSALNRSIRHSNKVAAALMQKAAGPWQEIPREEYIGLMVNAMEIESKKNGEIRIPSPKLLEVEKAFFNNHYEVLIRPFECEWGDCLHLYIRRVNKKSFKDWSVLQSIKNELVGPSRTAVEVYPPDNEVIDQHHWYHLWVFPGGMQIPFSLIR